MLVGISFSMPRQGRKLKAVASEIETNAQAEHGTVKASMSYFRKKEGSKEIDGLKTLKNFQQEWRQALLQYARYPFSADMRLLPASLVSTFVSINQSFEARQQAVIEGWLADEYPTWADTAPQRMGQLYDGGDFPSEYDCRARFKCDVTVIPLAEVDQWNRIASISPSLASTMQTAQNELTERVVRESHARLWSDVMAPLRNIVEQLSKDRTRIHSTLIENVIAIADIIPAYNAVLQDRQLETLGTRIKETLSAISAEDLRKDADTRTAALEGAKQLIEEYEPFARSFELDTPEEPETPTT